MVWHLNSSHAYHDISHHTVYKYGAAHCSTLQHLMQHTMAAPRMNHIYIYIYTYIYI